MNRFRALHIHSILNDHREFVDILHCVTDDEPSFLLHFETSNIAAVNWMETFFRLN